MLAVNLNTNATSIGNINPFRYRGYYCDTETGFYYLQTRYYDPTICRFINADDYELVADLASSMQLNMYAYCGNNPIMYTDETGEIVWVSALIGGIIGATFGGISAYISGENVWAGILIGGLTGAISGLFQNALVSGGLEFIGSLANSIINDGSITAEHFKVATISAGITVALSMINIKELGIINNSTLGDISNDLTSNTLSFLIEQTIRSLTIQTAVSIINSRNTDTNITKFYLVRYRGAK